MRPSSAVSRAAWLVVACATLGAVGCGGGDSGSGTTGPGGGNDNTPAAVSITPSAPQTLQSGTTVTLGAIAKNASGQTISGAAIGWSSSDQTVATVSAGLVVGVKVGTATITASAGSASASVTVSVTPGVAAALAMHTQPVGGVAGQVFATPAAVEVHDVAGNVVAASSASITAAIATGGGTLAGTTTVRPTNGIATFTDLSISGSAGDRTLTFSAPGLTPVTSATFTLTPDDTPASITLAPSTPVSVVSGATTTLAATVLAKDGHQVSPVITWTSSDTTVATVASGVVTGIKVGSATITATASPVLATTTVTVTPGAPAKLVIRTQPAGSALTVPFATQPVIELRDAAGNLATSSTASVTAAIASGGGTLTGTATVSAVAGVAAFSGLSITGVAGDRTLTFTSPGVASVTSATVTMTPPPYPVIVLDTTSFALQTVRGSSPVPRTVTVTDGGAVAISGVTVGAVQFGAGEAAGWLSATLTRSVAPFSVTLNASTDNLATGVYHATVPIVVAGAPNSPQNVTVTLTVIDPYTLTYGTSAEKLHVVDVGGRYTPTLSITSGGQPTVGVTATYTSRSTSVVTVDASGTITAVGPGEGWVVAAAPLAQDSVYVIVPQSANGTVVRPLETTYLAKAGDTTVITVILDVRGAAVGAASLGVGVQTSPDVFSSFQAFVPTETPQPVASSQTYGVYRVDVGSATGLSGTYPVLTLKLVGRAAGTVGWITITALDLAGVDGSDLTPLATSTRIPLVFK